MQARFSPLTISFLSFTLLTEPSFSQSERVLRGKELNESALIEALTPAPASSNDVRTRGIRVRENTQPVTPTSPSKAASASLLIMFETNSAHLTPQARQSLDIVGRALGSERLADFRFGVEGHADPRGGHELNLELSKQRAEAVRQYLVQNNYIEDRRLEAVGKGDQELLNKANPIAAENRRVTIVNLSQ